MKCSWQGGANPTVEGQTTAAQFRPYQQIAPLAEP